MWKNSLSITLSQGIRLFTNFAIVTGIARFYGTEVLGQFSIAFTTANIFLTITDFGFDVSLTTEIASHREKLKEISQKFFSVKILLLLISTFLMLLATSVFNFSPQSKILIYLLILYVGFTTLTNFYYALFRGLEKFEIETKISFFSNLVLLVSIAVMGFLKFQITFLITSFILARFFGLYLALSNSKEMIGKIYRAFNFPEFGKVFKRISVFGIHFLFGNIYFIFDTILIGLILGDHYAGVYRSAFTIMLLILVVPDVLRNAVLPLTARLFINQKDKWEDLNRVFIKILMLLGMSSLMLVYFGSEHILHTLYGNDRFNDAIPILKVFSFVILIRFLQDGLSLMITTSNRQQLLMITSIGAAAVSIIANYFVIKIYGIAGASFVCLIVNFMLLCFYILFNKKYFFRWILEPRIISVFIINICLGLILLYTSKNSGVIYPVFILSLLIAILIGFSKSERTNLLKGILRE